MWKRPPENTLHFDPITSEGVEKRLHFLSFELERDSQWKVMKRLLRAIEDVPRYNVRYPCTCFEQIICEELQCYRKTLLLNYFIATPNSYQLFSYL